MANISFGSLMKNPLVLGVLATEMTGNLAKSYTEAENQSRAEEALQTEKLKSVAAATGQIQTEVPREGLFGKIGAATGLISPTTPAKPYQIAEEGLAVQGQQAAMQQAVEAAISKRKELGPEGWQKFKSQLSEGNAFQKLLSSQLPDIPPTPYEKKQAEGIGKGATVIEYAQPGSGQQDKVVQKKPGEEAEAGYSFHVPPKPEKSLERIGEEAAARTAGGITGKLNSDIASSPNPYYDPTKGTPVTKSMTIAEARRAGYIPASPKAVQSYNDARTVTSKLDELDAIAQRRLPSTKGMNEKMAAIAIGKSWLDLTSRTKLLNLDNEANDLVYAGQLPAIQLIHQIQQRYPSTIEMNKIEPLIPGKTDSRESFHEKVQSLKAYLSSGINQGAREDAGTIIKSEGESAATDWIGGGDE
jgi:hypothetical protein